MSKVSKFRKISERLRGEIVRKKYAPGSKFLTQSELAARFKVNQITICRALNELVRDGLIVRRQGSGTFIADQLQPPLIPGKHLRLGLLWPYRLLPRRMDLSGGVGEITRGALSAWGLDPAECRWRRLGDGEELRAEWSNNERGVTAVAFGEPPRSADRAPDMAWIKKEKFDGILTVSIINNRWLEELLELNVPTLVVDYPNDVFERRTDQVFFDPGPGYRTAVRHFHQKGLRCFHFVGSTMTWHAPRAEMTPEEWKAYNKDRPERIDPDTHVRLSACRQAVMDLGVSLPEPWQHFIHPGKSEAKDLAEQLAGLPVGQRPEVVVCHARNVSDLLIQEFADRACAWKGPGVPGRWNRAWRTPFLPTTLSWVRWPGNSLSRG